MTKKTETQSDPGDGPVGRTQDAGWEIGVRRTLPYPAAAIWDLLMSDDGRRVWLGKGDALPTTPGTAYRTDDGTTGEVRSRDPENMIRLTWQPRGWETPSTLQLRLLPAASGTTLSIHQERLESGDRREEMRTHWSKVLDEIEATLART